MVTPWIKLEHTTPDKPEILAIADMLGISQGDAFLACVRVWIWADLHTSTGSVPFLSPSALDKIGTQEGLGRAMIAVGWLETPPGEVGIDIPHFETHMSQSAKARAQNSKRHEVARSVPSLSPICPSRRGTKVGQNGDASAPRIRIRVREEKEENTKPPPPPPPPPVSDKSPSGGGGGGEGGGEKDKTRKPHPGAPTAPEFMKAWNAVPEFSKIREMTSKRLEHFRARTADASWCANWREALVRASRSAFCTGKGSRGWRADVDWFIRPDTVTKLLEGRYDDVRGNAAPDSRTRRATIYQELLGDLDTKAEGKP